jgi:hypothetical protein
MKKTLLSLGLLLLFAGYAFGQNYYTYSYYGTKAPFLWNGNGITPSPIVGSPNNDVLSATQTIPFNFTFYGQTVTSYKASDNGYITFDNTATTSVPTSTALPSTTAPKNAIFGLWTDLELKTSGTTNNPSIRTWTYGSAPNRVHVIQWYYASVQGAAFGNSNLFVFSIRLYEAGGFDIVHTVDIYTAGFSNALIGAQNADGSVAVTVAGSPNLGPQNSTGDGSNAKDLVYAFKLANNNNDAAIIGVGIAGAPKGVVKRGGITNIIKGDALSFTGNVINAGKNAITSYDLNYTIDNGTPVVTHVTGVSIPPYNGSAAISVTPWTVDNPGTMKSIDIWVNNVNASKDPDSSNNGFSTTAFVLQGTNGVKKVLLEEGSGAWCGWCPDGHRLMTNLLAIHPEAIGIVYHNSDLMAINDGNTINSTYTNSYPYGMVDRSVYPDIAASVGLSRDLWEQAFTESNATPSVPVDLQILTKTWDPTTRQISFTVTVKTKDYIAGDLRLNAMIKEDKVRGPDVRPVNQLGWTQHNYLSKYYPTGGVPGNPLYDEDEWLVGYFHNHVAEKLFNGAFGAVLGAGGITPPGQTFTQTFTWTLPSTTSVTYPGATATTSLLRSIKDGQGQFKPEDINLVAYVSLYTADATQRNILNTTETPLFYWRTGIETAAKTEVGGINIYPNPTAGNTQMEYILSTASEVSVEIYNVLGEKVQTLNNGNQTQGSHTISFDTKELTNGLYFVTVKANGTQTTKKFMVQR